MARTKQVAGGQSVKVIKHKVIRPKDKKHKRKAKSKITKTQAELTAERLYYMDQGNEEAWMSFHRKRAKGNPNYWKELGYEEWE